MASGTSENLGASLLYKALSQTIEVPTGKSADIHLRSNTFGFIGITFALLQNRGCYMVFGGNVNETNSGQKASVIALKAVENANITVSVSNTSGKYNHVIVTNGSEYPFYLVVIANQLDGSIILS